MERRRPTLAVLDRVTREGDRDPAYQQQGRARRTAEGVRHGRARPVGGDRVPGPRHGLAAARLVEHVDLLQHLGAGLRLQRGEALGRQRDALVDQRYAVLAAGAQQDHHLRARPQPEGGPVLRVGPRGAGRENVGHGAERPPVAVDEAQEAEARPVARMGHDLRAAPVLALQQALPDEVLHGLADRPDGDAEVEGQLRLARQVAPRLPGPVHDPAQQQVAGLQVERAARQRHRHGRGHRSGRDFELRLGIGGAPHAVGHRQLMYMTYDR